MKPEDLMVGNYLYDGNEMHIADLLTISMSHKYNSIPLTEEWLIKLGVEKYHGVYRIKLKEDYYIRGQISKRGFECCIDDSSCDIEGRISINIGWYKHVHQLQNLYFALTHKKLKLEE
jgi:hypothetical protein